MFLFCYFELAMLLIRISITKFTQGGTLELVGTVNVLCVGVSMRGIDRPTLPPISIRAPPRVIPLDYMSIRASAISVWPQPTAGGSNGRKKLQWQALWGN